MTEPIETNSFDDPNHESWLEVAALTDYITQYGSGSSLSDIKLSDLYSYLQNPYSNIKQIQKASKYLTNKHGVIKEVLRALKTLPTLNYHLHWSSYENYKQINKYEKKIYDFLDEIDIKEVVRDGMFEVGEMGTIVTCLRKNKYVQFLDIDDLRIISQRNGKWVVEHDLSTIDTMRTYQDKLRMIESLPEEVTVERFNLYKNKGEDYRYVELSNCDVIGLDARRNFPYGLPMTLGAWNALLQKEVINRVERSVADRLIKQVLILYAGTIDKEGNKPPPKELIQSYFKEVSRLMKKKEMNGARSTNETSGTGVIALPKFMELKSLEVDTQMFKKELYEKIDNDIFLNLGISSSILWGGGSGDYSSSTLNTQKFFRYITTIVEKFEKVINRYIQSLLPNNLSCKFYFDKTTILDQDAHIENTKTFYQNTGIFAPYAEAVLGVPYHYAIGQAQYEREVLKLDDKINPPENFFNQSKDSGKAGRPTGDANNENTNQSKSSGSNQNPRPSS